MKKLTLAALVATSIMATSAFAEDPYEVVNFNGQIQKNIAGTDSAITGADGGTVVNGAISVDDKGAFTTTQSVILEHHTRTDGDVDEALVPETTWNATQLRYYINGQEVQSAALTLTTDDGTGTAKELAKKVENLPSTSTPFDDTGSKLILSVTGSALSDLDELAAKVTPGINDVQVLATITAKAITP